MKTVSLRPVAATRIAAADSPSKAQRLSLANLWTAPHRIAFFVATVLLLAVSFGWTWMLVAPIFGMTVVTALPPTMAHAFVFAAAYMPLYIAGFMFTAGPRWLQVAPPTAERLRWPLALHVGGIALLLTGTVAGTSIAAFGALLLAIAWTAIGVAFAVLVRASRVADRLHARCVVLFWIVGIAAALLFAAGMGTHHYTSAGLAAWLLLFGSVGPISVTVAHRILPFFTSNAVAGLVPWRPNWVLALLLASMIGLGVVLYAPRIEALHGATWLAIPTTVAGIALAALAIRWGLMQSLRGPSLRLLAMLHLAFAWLPLALLLAAADAGLRLALGGSGLGLGPLHALTLGMLGSLLFAMVTRVIRGHGGIALVADDLVWVLFWLLQVATLLRIASPLTAAAGGALAAAAASVWTAVWTAWAFVHLPILLRARADSVPG
ncbi:MAG TPA: NnrS family protein [Burkholderiaceae bacterium]|nr:NnrS family protein [Burkholderiaceae bacterium]